MSPLAAVFVGATVALALGVAAAVYCYGLGRAHGIRRARRVATLLGGTPGPLGAMAPEKAWQLFEQRLVRQLDREP